MVQYNQGTTVLYIVILECRNKYEGIKSGVKRMKNYFPNVMMTTCSKLKYHVIRLNSEQNDQDRTFKKIE